MPLESFDQSWVHELDDDMNEYYLSQWELKEWKDPEWNSVFWNQADIDTLRAANRHRVRELLYDFLYK